MKPLIELLNELDARPGDELVKEAAARITYLNNELINASQVADFLGRHKIILRSALVRIVGVELLDELKGMKASLEALVVLHPSNRDIAACLAGVKALLDTI